MTTKRICTLIAAAALSASAIAQGSYFSGQGQGLPMPQQASRNGEFAEVVMAALANQDGYSKAEVDGPLAQRLKNDNKTRSPVFVEVRRLSRIDDPDQQYCYNMRMRITMPELVGTGGKTVDFGYDMKMCSDGRPPQSVIEREKRQLRALMQQQQEQRLKNGPQN